MTRPVVYLVPVADEGFVPVDPLRNPVRWSLEDSSGKPVMGLLWTRNTQEAARAAGAAAGFEVF